MPSTPSLANAAATMDYSKLLDDNEAHFTAVSTQHKKVLGELQNGVAVLAEQLETTNKVGSLMHSRVIILACSEANESYLEQMEELSKILEVESRKWKKIHDQDVQDITLGAAKQFD